DERNPANGVLGEAEFQFGVALESSEVKHVHERIEKRGGAVAQSHVEDPLALAGFHGVDRGSDRSRLGAAADMVRHDDARLLGSSPKDIPGLQVHLQSDIVYQKIGFAEPQLCYP